MQRLLYFLFAVLPLAPLPAAEAYYDFDASAGAIY